MYDALVHAYQIVQRIPFDAGARSQQAVGRPRDAFRVNDPFHTMCGVSITSIFYTLHIYILSFNFMPCRVDFSRQLRLSERSNSRTL